MLYSILIYVDESRVDAMSAAEEEEHVVKHIVIHDKLVEQGKMGPVVRLMPTSTAVQVRTKGEPMLIDGPFAETKEQFLGFYIVDCETLQEAIDAARGFLNETGSLEIRPLRFFERGGNILPR